MARPSAELIGLYFPRIRKNAKRLIVPRVQALIQVGERTFSLELSAPVEGLKLFETLSLPMLGHVFQEIARKTIEQKSQGPKAGKRRYRASPTKTQYDAAIATAMLLGPLLWQWLTRENDKKEKTNYLNILKTLKMRNVEVRDNLKEVFAILLQTNWENDHGTWPGRRGESCPYNDPEGFFRKVDGHGRLEHTTCLLPISAEEVIGKILEGTKGFNLQLRNGRLILPGCLQ